MVVLVQEDHSIPNVAIDIFFRVGSRNERPGLTGISHFLEHMMFNGAKEYGPGEFDRLMEAGGGSNNAYTTQNITVYEDLFPRTALDLVFALEADRLRDLTFTPKTLASERGVIASERQDSVDSDNTAYLNEQLWAAAFTAHPYQWPVIGWASDIESLTCDDLRNYLQAGYSPANAILVVCGDVTVAEIVKLAEKHIEPIPSAAPPSPVRTREPEQRGERRVLVKRPGQLPLLQIAYHVPATADPDYFPLQVLENVLFSGESSRMYRRLVDRDQLALSVSGGSDFAFDPTLFEVDVQPKTGVDPATVEQAIYEELAKIADESATTVEIEKARNILLAGFYDQMRTIQGRSDMIGTYEVFFGDHRRLFTTADDLAKVSQADVRRVAIKYFTEKNRTVATLIPEAAAGE